MGGSDFDCSDTCMYIYILYCITTCMLKKLTLNPANKESTINSNHLTTLLAHAESAILVTQEDDVALEKLLPSLLMGSMGLKKCSIVFNMSLT